MNKVQVILTIMVYCQLNLKEPTVTKPDPNALPLSVTISIVVLAGILLGVLLALWAILTVNHPVISLMILVPLARVVYFVKNNK